MSMTAFVAGELIRPPESKTAGNGNPYTVALLRCNDTLVSLSVFDAGLRERMAELRKGDPLAAAGRLSCRPYLDKNDEPQPGLSVLVNEIMTMPARKALAAPRPKAPKAEVAPDFDDEIPF